MHQSLEKKNNRTMKLLRHLVYLPQLIVMRQWAQWRLKAKRYEGILLIISEATQTCKKIPVLRLTSLDFGRNSRALTIFRLIIYLQQRSKKENQTSVCSVLEPEHVTKRKRLFKLCSKEVKASPLMQTVVFTEKRRKRSIPSPQSPLPSLSEAAAA